jgi:hypothetical protein
MKLRFFLANLQRCLIVLLLILLPSNLFKKFGLEHAYVQGLFVDYLLPKFYLTDIFTIGLLASWVAEGFSFSWLKSKKNRNFIFAFFGLATFFVLRQFFSPAVPSSLWYLAKLGEMVILAAFLKSHWSLFSCPRWAKILGISLLLHSGLAIWQFLTQSNFFPSYAWFGEPRLAQPIGLAHMVWGGVERVLPYGISAHPNILGGFLSLGLLAFWWASERKKSFFTILVSFFTILAIFFTNSVSAWLCLVLGVVVLFVEQKISLRMLRILSFTAIFVLLIGVPISLHLLRTPFAENTSIVRRDELNQAGLKMFFRQPIVGVGLNAFTTQVENIYPSQELVRFVQPVHNLAYLWLAETGVVGLGILAIGLWVLLKHDAKNLLLSFLILLPILTLDHYFLTNQTGLLMLAIGVSLLTCRQGRV